MVSTTGGATPHDPNEQHHYYRQNSAPVSVAAGGSDPLQVGDIWSDTTNNLVKRCTGVNADTFASIEGGGSGSLTTIKEAGAQLGGADIVVLDFGAGFDLTETPDTEINIGLDLSELTDQTLQLLLASFTAATELTISTGDVTATQSFHSIDTQADDPSDDLIGINGGSAGDLLAIRPASDARTVVVKHNGSAGAVDNILLNGGVDISLTEIEDVLLLIWDATLDTNGAWLQVGGRVFSVAQAAVTAHEAAIDHDALTNFVAAEHVLEASIDHDALSNFLSAEHFPVTDATSDPLVDADAAADGTEATVARKDHVHPKHQSREVVLNFIIDGGGSTITTGLKGDVEMAFAGTITAVRLFANQSGAIVVDIWKDAYANFPPLVGDTITASAKPTITASGVKSEDATLTGWTVAITKGDILRFNVDSVTSIQRLTISLSIDKT